ncbi:MAG TPA: Hpt domain-containing protein [Dokdonella sp.]|uniref:response regulator n=1 Tax=Dokdonella sp. TaxID=2291710 RepID=UPI0025B9593E|nr:Hpt domain-containing protein [Dokdonella sp.]MBX3691770.1 response regulator [Dokdonella sp.]HNR92241.1 Hpt domain-containing protein [Dokdonella sp.]
MNSDQGLARLRERYQGSLPEKRELLQRTWVNFREQPGSDATRDELCTLLHRLAGSASSYGYARLGAAARAADDCIATFPDSADLVGELAPHVDAVLAQLSAAIDATDAVVERGLRVILVEDDLEQALMTRAGLEGLGCEVMHIQRVESFRQAAAAWPCDAIVIDYHLGTHTAHDILDLVREEPGFTRTVLICYSSEEDATIRRRLSERGCDACLCKREPVRRLHAVLRDCVEARRREERCG